MSWTHVHLQTQTFKIFSFRKSSKSTTLEHSQSPWVVSFATLQTSEEPACFEEAVKQSVLWKIVLCVLGLLYN
jgi:hypothetical protein